MSARSFWRRMRVALRERAAKLRILGGATPGEDAAAARAVDADLAAARSLLADGETLLLNNARLCEVAGAIGRVAEADGRLGEGLRRVLAGTLFAGAGSGTDLAIWIGGGVRWVEIGLRNPATPGEAVREVVTALKDGAGRVVTPSVTAAYVAALADIPTALDLRAPLDPGEATMLRDLARLPSLEGASARSEELVRQALDTAPALAGRVRRASADPASMPGRSSPRGRVNSANVRGIDASPRDHPAAAETDGARILWLYGSEEQSGWAYGVNAQRLAAQLDRFQHTLGAKARRWWKRYDIKFSFDVLVARQRHTRKTSARKSIIRVGGPAPLHQVSGGDRAALAAFLTRADGLIVLSPELEDMLAPLHPRVYFIPNGLDLDVWNPAVLRPSGDSRRFRAGLAASLRDEGEQELKGLPIAQEACALAGVPLLAVGRGMNHVPHERMIEDFYSQIDVLVHPTGPGKEACSNVIMEALALGIPVITTRYAGMHGQLLQSGEEALVVPRFALSFAAALRELKGDGQLRQGVAAGGRLFAERFHDLKSIGREYERVFDIVLRTN